MAIIQKPTSNFFPDRNGFKPHWLIVHGTAGGSSAIGVAQDFINSQGTSNPRSTHYVIGRDGQIVQCVQEKDGAYGNGVPEPGCDAWWNNGVNPNYTTISIEHVKPDSENASALTDAQKDASFNLIRDICHRNNIPTRKADSKGGITGHFSISPVDRAHCPGTYPWQDLFNFLQGDDMLQITDPFAKTFFVQQSANAWKCKNGFVVADGILGAFRRFGGSPRLPLSGEKYDIPGVAYQIFEAGVLVYDPEGKIDAPGFNGCYLLKWDSDLARKINGIAAKDAEIQTLQDAIKNMQPGAGIDKAGLQSDLTTAQVALNNAINKLGA